MTDPAATRLADRLADLEPLLQFPYTTKAMFGGIMVYADGRPVASLSDVGFGLKASNPTFHAELLALSGALRLRYGPNQPGSRSYVVIPDTIVDDDHHIADLLNSAALAARTSAPTRKKATRK